jgi:hypothetical protein
MTTLVIAQRLQSFSSCWLYGPGTLVNTRCPSRIKPGMWGMWTTDRSDSTGRAAVGRAGSINPEEQRSSRFRSYGPPQREERFSSFRS